MKQMLLFAPLLVTVLSNAFGQSKETYLPSPGLSKLNGTWVGSLNGINLKIVLKSVKTYIKDGDYTTDLLQGNFACSNAEVSTIAIDTTFKAITEGHYYDQAKKDLIVFYFTDTYKNHKKGRGVLTPIEGNHEGYKLNIVSRRKIKQSNMNDNTFSIPTPIIIKKVE